MKQEKDTAVTHTTYRIQISPKTAVNQTKLIQAAHQLGITTLTTVHPSRLIFLQGHLTPSRRGAPGPRTPGRPRHRTIHHHPFTIHN